jgi:hypothetical protein
MMAWMEAIAIAAPVSLQLLTISIQAAGTKCCIKQIAATSSQTCSCGYPAF